MMYDFTDRERKRFSNCAFFRSACYQCYANGMTKEEAMSEIVMALLEGKDKRDKEELKRALESTSPIISINDW